MVCHQMQQVKVGENCTPQHAWASLAARARLSSSYFLPKNDMMLPCPGLAAPFLAAPLAAGAGVGLAFFGAGSSSEKDSHAASSRVTVASQHLCDDINVIVLLD
jgi:hypothetical protein